MNCLNRRLSQITLISQIELKQERRLTMSRTVFILGAGASADAGAPLMNDFLDRADELRKTRNCDGKEDQFDLIFEAIKELRGIHEKSHLNTLNIEDVFSAIEMGRIIGKIGNIISKEKIEKVDEAIRFFISITLERTMLFNIHKTERRLVPCESHLRFVDVLRKLEEKNVSSDNRKRSSIITFNYDLAIDIALLFANLQFDYCFNSEPEGDKFHLLKLHGSLNWGKCRVCGKFSSTTFWKLGESKDGSCIIKGNPGSASHCGHHVLDEPELIPPTWNKSQYSGSITNVWKQAAKELSEAEEIITIGYSLPITDLFFKYLFALGTDSETRIKRFIVCNPDEKVTERFLEIIGRGIENRFEFVHEYFKEFMILMQGDTKLRSKHPNFRHL